MAFIKEENISNAFTGWEEYKGFKYLRTGDLVKREDTKCGVYLDSTYCMNNLSSINEWFSHLKSEDLENGLIVFGNFDSSPSYIRGDSVVNASYTFLRRGLDLKKVIKYAMNADSLLPLSREQLNNQLYAFVSRFRDKE